MRKQRQNGDTKCEKCNIILNGFISGLKSTDYLLTSHFSDHHSFFIPALNLAEKRFCFSIGQWGDTMNPS